MYDICVEMEYFCHISKQECHNHQRFWPFKCEFPSPKGTQEEKNTCMVVAIRLQPLPTVSTEKNSGCEKHRNLSPRENGDAYEKNDFKVSSDSCVSISRKALNSLTWDI